MAMIKSNREIWGLEFPLGGPWDAGFTAPHTPAEKAGRWTVHREPERFAVYFHLFNSGQDVLLKAFPNTEQGEVDAKVFALVSCQNKTYQN
jgi:hypothetical protein